MAHQRKSKGGQRRRSIGRTSPSGPTIDPSRVLIEATEFLHQMKGTLPEQITAADLERLNAGLRFFFSDLRRASELFAQSKSGGRAGVVKAMAATWRLVALFRQPYAENLFVPILQLQDALQALDQNTVAPMLRPINRSGRSSSLDVRAALRGHAAGTVARLVEANVSPPDARALVAEALVALGVRPERGSKQITARTVRTWCEEVAEDVGRHGAAAIVYDGMFTNDERRRFSALVSDRDRHGLALNSLAGFVGVHFPSAHGRLNEPEKPT